MDLKAILASNKSKTEKANLTRKPVDIADQDRPYSLAEVSTQHHDSLNPLEKISRSTPPLPIPNPEERSEQVAAFENNVANIAEKNLASLNSEINNNLETKSAKEIVSKALAEREHSVIKPLAKSERSVSNALAKTNESVSNLKEKREQSVSIASSIALAKALAKTEVETGSSVSISLAKREQEWATSLTGKEDQLLNILFQNCQANGSLETSRLTSEYLRNSLENIGEERLRNLIYRLSKKQVIKVIKIKNGRGGWRRFAFSQDTFKQIYNHKALAMREQPLTKNNQIALAKALAEPLASALVGEGDFKLKPSSSQLPEEWRKINRDPFFSIGSHLGLKELNNIYQKCSSNLTPAIVERSILHYVWSVKNNSPRVKKVKEHTGFFVDHMQQDENGWIEPNYISEEELENTQRRQNQLMKLEKQFKNPKFIEWFQELGEKEKEELVPKEIKSTPRYTISKDLIIKEHAIKFFDKEIWPDILKQLEE